VIPGGEDILEGVLCRREFSRGLTRIKMDLKTSEYC
jgi:hypothetical protein